MIILLVHPLTCFGVCCAQRQLIGGLHSSSIQCTFTLKTRFSDGLFRNLTDKDMAHLPA